MAFVTEIPSVEDARHWQADKWLHNEYSLWTIDRARRCWLVFLHQNPATQSGAPEREDYCFSWQGWTGFIRMVLQLEHNGCDLVYHWHLASRLDLTQQLQRNPAPLQSGAADIDTHWDEAKAQEALRCLQEAFLHYKAHLGLHAGGGQQVVFDTTPPTGQLPQLDI